jgi:two-component system response regulator MtrA
LRDVLEPEGYDVVAVDHPDALTGKDPERVDLILIDLMLPGRSGVKLAGELRANGFVQTPIVAISASPILLHVAQQSGLFQETLSKPFDLSRLLECVRSYTNREVV